MKKNINLYKIMKIKIKSDSVVIFPETYNNSLKCQKLTDMIKKINPYKMTVESDFSRTYKNNYSDQRFCSRSIKVWSLWCCLELCLTLTSQWANLEDNKLMIFFFLFF